MPSRNPSRLLFWLQGLAVVLVTVLVTGLMFQRSTWSDWSRPQWLEGDPVEVYTRVKIAGEQPGHALLRFNQIDRLGAPTYGDWTAYPAPDRLVFVLTGLLGRMVGVITAVNLVAALILGLNAASFYLCARWLRYRVEWAFAGALIFALAVYNVRWGITLSLNQVFVIPPLLLLCAHAARRGAPTGSNRNWIILATLLGLWLGWANPYHAYFAGVVAGGGLVLACVRRSPAARLRPLLVFLVCLVASFIVANAIYLVPSLQGVTQATLLRGPNDLVVYALRPLDWLVPPADHRWAAFRRLGAAYQAARQGPGEFFYNYLGLLGIAGLVALLATAGRAALRRRWSRLDAMWGLLWICAFAMPLGLNRWVGAAGLDVFRAGTRIGVYALVWVLFFVAGRLNRHTRRWSRRFSAAFALVVGFAACWEQTLPFRGRAETADNVARWNAHTALTRALESSLPPRAMIFQLPVVPFPEAGRTVQMPDYEHALPFLTSHTLRFSYGQLRPAPALAWAKHISRLPAAEFAAAAERAGFSAVWINPRGYADGGASLVAALTAAGRPGLQAPEKADGIWVFRLRPPATPELPDFSDPRLNERWNERIPDGAPLVLALRGWFPGEYTQESHWRWATRDAALGLWREGPATRATLRFKLGGPAASRVAVRQGEKTPGLFAVSEQNHEMTVELQPGLNTLEWRLEGATFRPGGADPRELGFMVENLSVSVP
jgi:phosphoglycerol transferase